jgi:hypothetical protein
MRLSSVLVVPVALLALAGCTSNQSSNITGPEATGQLHVGVTDAPGDFDAVNLVVDEVSASRSDADGGWQVLSTGTSTVNLLTLQNGVFATLGDATVPAGTYHQVRLKLGAGSNVVVGGVTYPLTVPSGMSSGLKLNGAFDLTAGGVLSLQMDFDVSKSISLHGNGYRMDPVIRMRPATDAGAIAGLVAPAGVPTSVKVSQNGTEVCTNWVNSDGSFKVAVLPPGSYDILVVDQGGDALIFNGVQVTGGQTTSLGTLSFVFPVPSAPGPGGGGAGGGE